MMTTALLMLFPVLITLLLLWLTLRLLLDTQWFLGWLRGTAGMVTLLCTVGAGLFTYDMRTFSSSDPSHPLMVVSFSQGRGEGLLARAVAQSGNAVSDTVQGDLWRMSVKSLDWHISSFSGSLVRFDHLDGRYLTLEQQLQRGVQVRDISSPEQSDLAFDAHKLIQAFDSWLVLKLLDRLKGIESGVMTTNYMPLEVGAIYEVWQSEKGLEVRGVNETAKAAIDRTL